MLHCTIEKLWARLCGVAESAARDLNQIHRICLMSHFEVTVGHELIQTY